MERQITKQYWHKRACRSIVEAWESGLSISACMVGFLMSCLVERQRQRLKKQKAIRRVARVMAKVCLCSKKAWSCDEH